MAGTAWQGVGLIAVWLIADCACALPRDKSGHMAGGACTNWPRLCPGDEVVSKPSASYTLHQLGVGDWAQPTFHVERESPLLALCCLAEAAWSAPRAMHLVRIR